MVRGLSKHVRCKEHNLSLRIPVEDSEFVKLTNDVSELFSHLQEHPNCKFEVDKK